MINYLFLLFVTFLQANAVYLGFKEIIHFDNYVSSILNICIVIFVIKIANHLPGILSEKSDD